MYCTHILNGTYVIVDHQTFICPYNVSRLRAKVDKFNINDYQFYKNFISLF